MGYTGEAAIPRVSIVCLARSHHPVVLRSQLGAVGHVTYNYIVMHNSIKYTLGTTLIIATYGVFQLIIFKQSYIWLNYLSSVDL